MMMTEDPLLATDLVPRRRLELPRPCGHRYLKPARLPIPPPGHFGVPHGLRESGRARGVASAFPPVNRDAHGQARQGFVPMPGCRSRRAAPHRSVSDCRRAPDYRDTAPDRAKDGRECMPKLLEELLRPDPRQRTQMPLAWPLPHCSRNLQPATCNLQPATCNLQQPASLRTGLQGRLIAVSCAATIVWLKKSFPGRKRREVRDRQRQGWSGGIPYAVLHSVPVRRCHGTATIGYPPKPGTGTRAGRVDMSGFSATLYWSLRPNPRAPSRRCHETARMTLCRPTIFAKPQRKTRRLEFPRLLPKCYRSQSNSLPRQRSRPELRNEPARKVAYCRPSVPTTGDMPMQHQANRAGRPHLSLATPACLPWRATR